MSDYAKITVLKRMTPDYARRILFRDHDHEIAYVFLSDGRIWRLDGVLQAISVDEEDRKQLVDALIIHCHPAKYRLDEAGISYDKTQDPGLSNGDCAFTAGNNLYAMEVLDHGLLARLERPEGGWTRDRFSFLEVMLSKEGSFLDNGIYTVENYYDA